jgi:hypothetical protein
MDIVKLDAVQLYKYQRSNKVVGALVLWVACQKPIMLDKKAITLDKKAYHKFKFKKKSNHIYLQAHSGSD